MTREELKTWRLSKGLSQAKLARLLNVTVMAVSRWERGVRSIPALLPMALDGLERQLERKGQ